MGLFRPNTNSAHAVQDISTVRNLRKSIFSVRDNLRGTKQFSELFYSLIKDVNHPPRKIEANQRGCFWTEAWEPAVNNYEPFSTQKLQNNNIGYIEGCAVYLLIQECYPNVYNFPSNRVAEIQNGATIELIMKKQFIGKPINPTSPPQRIQQAPAMVAPAMVAPAVAAPAVAAPAVAAPAVAAPAVAAPAVAAPAVAAPAVAAPVQNAPAAHANFCGKCGQKLQPGNLFCPSCGNRID